METLNRRHFLGCAAACTCAAAYVPAHADTTAQAAITPAVTPALAQFRHGEVQLGEGPMLTQFRHQHALYLGLDNDALLKPFRSRSGMPAPGADMGGWYDNTTDFHWVDGDPRNTFHGFIPGHSFGQYVSGLSRDYAITGDAATKAKITALISGYRQTISPKFFDDYTLPGYTFDKLVVGMIDAYHFAGVAEAKPALDAMTDAALPYLPEKALNRDQRRHRPYNREAQNWDETYTLPENLFLAWQRGMGERYKTLAARYIEDDTWFDPLSRGISPLKGEHAYSHVNSLSSAVQAYLVLGDEKHLRAAKNGFAYVEAQSYATGGWGPNETLLAPDDTHTLYDLLRTSHAHFETPCGVYGHFKIARYLLRITGDSHYGDSMERILYNTIMGAKPTEADGRTFYYSDYNQAGTKKGFHNDKWPCCSGTFIQLTADYGVSAYLFDAQRLYVNLYVPSSVQAMLGGQKVMISQSTAYPLGNITRLTLKPEKPAEFGVSLRIPGWAGPNTRITVNGQPWHGALTPGHFAEVVRTWKAGDTIEVSFDMGLRLEPLDAAHPEMVAVMTGPLVLFPIADPDSSLTRDQWLSARPKSPDTWTVQADSRTVTLKPFMAIGDETYRLYSQLKTA